MFYGLQPSKFKVVSDLPNLAFFFSRILDGDCLLVVHEIQENNTVLIRIKHGKLEHLQYFRMGEEHRVTRCFSARGDENLMPWIRQ